MKEPRPLYLFLAVLSFGATVACYQITRRVFPTDHIFDGLGALVAWVSGRAPPQQEPAGFPWWLVSGLSFIVFLAAGIFWALWAFLWTITDHSDDWRS
jgi:hypothetical protein